MWQSKPSQSVTPMIPIEEMSSFEPWLVHQLFGLIAYIAVLVYILSFSMQVPR